jgi:ribosome biogenesis protein UTP30
LFSRVQVIGVTELRAEYKTYESKRKLCAMYDYFFSDDRIQHMLPKLLGVAFFRSKK